MKKKISHCILPTLMLSAINVLSIDDNNSQSFTPIKHPKLTLNRNDYCDARSLYIQLSKIDEFPRFNHPTLTSPHALETDKSEAAYQACAAYFSTLPSILEDETKEVSDSPLQLIKNLKNSQKMETNEAPASPLLLSEITIITK